MKTRLFPRIALCLAVCLLLSGCSGLLQLLPGLGGGPSFSDMPYVRPDITNLCQMADKCATEASTTESVSALMDTAYQVFYLYNDFMTNYSLANIRYCQNMTDIYWQTEYDYCLAKHAQVVSAMDQMLYALADSPFRMQLESDQYFGAGYFDAYEGDSLWDETFTDLMEQEAALLSKYYEISAASVDTEYYSEEFFNTYGNQLVSLFVELVALRQQIGAYAGYDSYAQFAYEYYYLRDYTCQQVAVLLESIQRELVPAYREYMPGFADAGSGYCSEEETLSYLKTCTDAMGGVYVNAFSLMQQRKLYDITYSPNKFNASFETFLPTYAVPFLFMNPTGTDADKLILSHEFGHFCSDYAAGGSGVSIDVAEIFSQAMEYMTLCYANDPDLTDYKTADSLGLFVEQAAYACFEEAVYALDPKELTEENVVALFGSICQAYGQDLWDRDSRDFVLVSHFFTNPLYVIGYVVSNDAALQICQLELEQPGQGLALLTQNLSTTQWSFLAFLESAYLESPFQDNRGQQILKTLQMLSLPSGQQALPAA